MAIAPAATEINATLEVKDIRHILNEKSSLDAARNRRFGVSSVVQLAIKERA